MRFPGEGTARRPREEGQRSDEGSCQQDRPGLGGVDMEHYKGPRTHHENNPTCWSYDRSVHRQGNLGEEIRYEFRDKRNMHLYFRWEMGLHTDLEQQRWKRDII